MPNPMATILRQQDSLHLTSHQADSIASMNRRYTYRTDSIWVPVARYLAALPAHFDDDAAYDRYLQARHAQVDMLIRMVPTIRELLTDEQRRKLPPQIVNVLDPRYLVSVRNGTGLYVGGTTIGPVGFVPFFGGEGVPMIDRPAVIPSRQARNRDRATLAVIPSVARNRRHPGRGTGLSVGTIAIPRVARNDTARCGSTPAARSEQPQRAAGGSSSRSFRLSTGMPAIPHSVRNDTAPLSGCLRFLPTSLALLWAGASLGMTALRAGVVFAQTQPAVAGPPVRHISTASAVSTEQLGSITSVRELPGGRLLLNDGARRRLVLMDTTLKTIDVVLDSLTEVENSYGTRPGTLIAVSRRLVAVRRSRVVCHARD